MLTKEAVQEILGIKGNVMISPEDMASDLKVTFFPLTGKGVDANVLSFSEELKKTLLELGVKIVNYEDVLENVSFYKRLRRIFLILLHNTKHYIFKFRNKESFHIPLVSIKRVVRKKRLKKNVSIIALGELDSEFLPMQFISSFKTNSVINIVSFPIENYELSDFNTHYDKAMSLFSYHMANIIIGVSDKKWILYNFNASHPIFSRVNNFKNNILQALVPKIYAPISPNLLSEFRIINERFDPKDKEHHNVVTDIKDMAKLFAKTSLFPEGKKINDLPFRDNFHKFIGKIHLDNRNGMSFGFISKQMPTILTQPKIDSAGERVLDKDFFYDKEGQLNVVFKINLKNRLTTISMKVPDVWVMTLRSGSNKTNFNEETDLLKIGLRNGEMYMQFPKGVKINGDYRPSFDTKVILAQAVGNGIIASILKWIDSNTHFSDVVEKDGISIVHWHGYLNPSLQIEGLYDYGHKNPHVACSSPQSAIYSLSGKLENFINNPDQTNLLLGHVHIEPHHGINVSHVDMLSLANDIISSPNQYTSLGNEYLVK
jgi:hypothetical protein